MLSTEYYFKAPVAYEAVSPNPKVEWDFEDFCTWVTRRVPDALVYNAHAPSGSGPADPEPFVWNDSYGVRIEHPDHPTREFSGGIIAFVDGWFEGVATLAQYPSEWSPERNIQGV